MGKAERTFKEETRYPKKNKPLIFPIRMSPETVELLNEVAEWKGTPTSTLARMWIMERLAIEREAHPDRSRFGEWVKKEIEMPAD